MVIERDGKKYIVTNAHVAENAVNLRVRFANTTKKYQAKCICFSPQSDLALLEVNDLEFQKVAKPAQLGEMVKMEQVVETVGFPIGGKQVNISKGIVSRIEVSEYCESNHIMLHVGVDAAINPGNSGGPVFSGGKVVGISFQGYDRQGLGFIIPMPIVHHFLEEAFSGKPYRGYPVIPFNLQNLDNPGQRAHYGMKPEQSGVRVKHVDNLSDAYNKLKVDDILLEIDGLKISNDAKVDMPGIGNVIDLVHVAHSKFIGDSVKFKVLRKNKEKNRHEILNISVKLDCVPGDSTKVPAKEFFKTPTYYVNSGIAFAPLTLNYMEDRGAEFEEMIDRDLGLKIFEIPKLREDEQYVVINDVLDCEATDGYEDNLNDLVKVINEKPIHNIHDVVEAMDNHQGDHHVIKTRQGSVIVVKNMTREENAELLARYEIHADRSKDLKEAAPIDAMDVDHEFKKPAPKPKLVKPVAIRAKASTAKVLEKVDEIMPDFEKSDEKSESSEETVELTRDQLPGLKRYQAKLNQMEHFYNQFEPEALELHDDAFAANEEEASSDEIEEDSVEQEEVKQRARSSRLAGKQPTLFQPVQPGVNKRKRDDEDEEENHNQKRARHK